MQVLCRQPAGASPPVLALQLLARRIAETVQVLGRFISGEPDLREILRSSVALFQHHRICVRMIHAGLDLSQYAEADRPEVNPAIEVEAATWAAAGQLDWWSENAESGSDAYACQMDV